MILDVLAFNDMVILAPISVSDLVISSSIQMVQVPYMVNRITLSMIILIDTVDRPLTLSLLIMNDNRYNR